MHLTKWMMNLFIVIFNLTIRINIFQMSNMPYRTTSNNTFINTVSMGQNMLVIQKEKTENCKSFVYKEHNVKLKKKETIFEATFIIRRLKMTSIIDGIFECK